jgi:hypothetical protein
MTATPTAALGCAAHSGWAVVVGVSLAGGRCQVRLRERLEMMDPRDPASKQPYHTVENLPVAEAADRLARYAATAEQTAGEGLRRIVDLLAQRGHRTVGLGLLESSGRKGGSLAAILASHALIHTADGDHYRRALAASAAGLGLPVVRVRARDLDERAAEVMGEPLAKLRVALDEAGRDLGPPWGADQKAAALLAWLVLKARGPPSK